MTRRSIAAASALILFAALPMAEGSAQIRTDGMHSAGESEREKTGPATISRDRRGARRIVVAQNEVDCSGAGAKVAAKTGGTVLSVASSGGSCVVTVLVPGKDGERPRKVTMTVKP